MKNLCNDCKFAQWDMDSVSNAYCNQNPVYKVISNNNYVTGCPSYKSNNVITCIINFLQKNDH